jgi:hypothetical protein
MFEEGRPSQEVTGLIRRLRRLVAEKRELERAGIRELLEAESSEIARLQERLAAVVKRELVH